MKSIKVFTRSIVFFTVCSTFLTFTSCGEVYDLNGFDWEPEIPASDSVFNREIQILDLGPNNIPQTHRPLDESDPMYFSLEKLNSIHLAYKTTDRWDITFGGMYRTSISGNNGKVPGYGYGSPAQGGIIVLDLPYDEVKEVPDDNLFITPGIAGLDGQGAFGAGLGHVIYTFFGNFIRPDIMEGLESSDPAVAANANLYQHMMYATSQDFVKAFPNSKSLFGEPLRARTVVIRTSKGNYAKLETQSYYKGVTDPLRMRRGTDMPVGYVTFRYTLLKKEDKRFGFNSSQIPQKPKLTINLTTKRTTIGN